MIKNLYFRVLFYYCKLVKLLREASSLKLKNFGFIFLQVNLFQKQSPGGVLLKRCGLQLYQKETLAQVFSCKYSEIFRNTFFYRTPPVAASFILKSLGLLSVKFNLKAALLMM